MPVRLRPTPHASFWLKIDSGSQAYWNLLVSSSYLVSTAPDSYYLTPGAHMVTIYLSEDGTRLDWIQLYSSAVASNAAGRQRLSPASRLRPTNLATPPSSEIWCSYYSAGSGRIAMRVQESGVGNKVSHLARDNPWCRHTHPAHLRRPAQLALGSDRDQSVIEPQL